MVFTAVLAAIAVIAAMVTVPGGKAEAAEPTDFKPDFEIGGAPNTTQAKQWGTLTWAGPNISGVKANPDNNVGWAWCIDPMKHYPVTTTGTLYSTDNAEKLDIDPEYRDAVIRLGLKWQEAIKNEEKAKAATYVIYMAAIVGRDPIDRTTAAYTINGEQPAYNNPDGKRNFPQFEGSLEEFTEITGFELVSAENPGTNATGAGPHFKKVAEVPKQPDEYFITVVIPAKGAAKGAQRVIPPNQPGLPDTPDNGGGSEGPTTSPENPDTEENTTEETTSENPEGETSSSETTTDSEPTDSEETTTEDTEETVPSESTPVVPNPDPTPTTEE